VWTGRALSAVDDNATVSARTVHARSCPNQGAGEGPWLGGTCVIEQTRAIVRYTERGAGQQSGLHVCLDVPPVDKGGNPLSEVREEATDPDVVLGGRCALEG
jgi:hypothetical protein